MLSSVSITTCWALLRTKSRIQTFLLFLIGSTLVSRGPSDRGFVFFFDFDILNMLSLSSVLSDYEYRADLNRKRKLQDLCDTSKATPAKQRKSLRDLSQSPTFTIKTEVIDEDYEFRPQSPDAVSVCDVECDIDASEVLNTAQLEDESLYTISVPETSRIYGTEYKTLKPQDSFNFSFLTKKPTESTDNLASNIILNNEPIEALKDDGTSVIEEKSTSSSKHYNLILPSMLGHVVPTCSMYLDQAKVWNILEKYLK